MEDMDQRWINRLLVSKFKVQPIHYINPESPLAGDFKNAFSDYYNAGKKVHKEDKILLNYLMSAMMYMKPISGLEKIEGEEKPYIFQDDGLTATYRDT